MFKALLAKLIPQISGERVPVEGEVARTSPFPADKPEIRLTKADIPNFKYGELTVIRTAGTLTCLKVLPNGTVLVRYEANRGYTWDKLHNAEGVVNLFNFYRGEKYLQQKEEEAARMHELIDHALNN